MQQLYYSPGQKVTLYLEVTDGYYNRRFDSLVEPTISKIIFPDLSLADGFPQSMTKIGTGLYNFQYILPTGAASVGSYFVDGYYSNPVDGYLSSIGYQVIVTAPYGIYSASIV